jgi:hypothetical protein
MKVARGKINKRDAEANRNSAAVDPHRVTRLPLERASRHQAIGQNHGFRIQMRVLTDAISCSYWSLQCVPTIGARVCIERQQYA